MNIIENSFVRKALDAVLIEDSDLTAFIMDNFPSVERRFSSGMDRVQKLNILLKRISANTVYSKLRDMHPHEVEEYVESLNGINTNNTLKKGNEKFSIVITATISDLDQDLVKSLVEHLRKVSGDATLTLVEVKSGSVVFVFSGQEDTNKKLENEVRSGNLQKLGKYDIKYIKRMDTNELVYGSSWKRKTITKIVLGITVALILIWVIQFALTKNLDSDTIDESVGIPQKTVSDLGGIDADGPTQPGAHTQKREEDVGGCLTPRKIDDLSRAYRTENELGDIVWCSAKGAFHDLHIEGCMVQCIARYSGLSKDDVTCKIVAKKVSSDRMSIKYVMFHSRFFSARRDHSTRNNIFRRWKNDIHKHCLNTLIGKLYISSVAQLSDARSEIYCGADSSSED